MSNETLGIRVDLTGNKAAVDGLQGVTAAEKQLADATGKVNAANKDAKTSGDALNTTINQTANASTRGGVALGELEARSRSLANSQQGVAASMATSASAGSMLSNVMGLLARGAVILSTVMAVAAPAAAFSAAQDEAKVLLSRITQVTGSLEESRAVYRGLTEDAIRLRVGLNDTLSGYTRISMAVKELGGTSTQARQLNEMVIGTAKIMGVSAGEAAAAARQFAQALGSGVLQGDELRSILENNQELARQLAAGLGVSIGSLRKMGEEGKLTADVVATALLSRLPEMRAKLAEVPLTSADAWQKLTTVLSAWVVQGDSVEMKAGLIARSMNAIAEGIERARKAAATPIVVTVRQVYETQGGAAFIGPNLGRRDPAAIAAEIQIAANAENTRRASHVAAIRAADNAIVAESRLGLELLSKKAIEDAEKFADSVSLGSVKIQKAYDKEMKAITQQRAGLSKALTSGDPASFAIATAALEKLAQHELAFTADTQRKLAEAKKSEANKGMAEINAAAEAHYRQLIAKEEAYQQAIKIDVAAGVEVEKRKYELQLTDASTYYTAVANLQTIGLNLQQASVEKELAAARSRGQKGIAEAEKYLAELTAIERARVKVKTDADDNILAADRKYWSARIAELIAFDEASSKYAEGTYAVIKSAQDTREEQLFQVSLLGQTAQAQERAIALRKIEIERTRELTAAQNDYYRVSAAARTQEEQAAAAGGLAVRIKAINDAKDAQADLTVKVLETGQAYSQMSSFVDGFINAAFSGFKSLKDFLKNQLFDWLKQSLLKPFIMQIAASVTGGVAGTVANAATGGGSSIVGSVVSSVLGSGSFLGGILGTGGLAAAGTAFTTAMTTGVGFLGSLTAAATSLAASGGLLGSAAAGLLALGPVGWAVAAAGALYAIFGGKRDPGFKIDNNLTNVGNPASHFTANAISAYDISGRGTDAPEIQNALKPLTSGVNQIDDLLANKLLGADVLAKIRANMNQVNNASSWENLDAKGIEKGTLNFLMQRYGVIFDQVDAKIAASVRGFTGTSEELLRFIGGVVAVMQTLKDNAAYFAAVIGETVSVGQISALSKEGETLDQTLTRVVNVFTATNGVAALMGRDVTTAFGEVGLASVSARQNLIDLAGGIQQLDQMSQFYYENFYTEQERGARDLAAANASVAATFAELNLSVPETRLAFRQLVESQDLSTEAGRRTWTALMRIAGAFDVVHDAAEAATPPVVALGGEFFQLEYYVRSLGEGSVTAARQIETAAAIVNAVNIGTVIDAGTQTAQSALASLFAIIESTAESTGVKLQRKIAATGSLAAQLAAQYTAQVAADGGVVTAGALAIATARDIVLAQQADLAGNLALFTTMQAQYGQFGEQMYELELWHREQIASAMGNQATLLLIEQSYQARREAILNGGVASGLSSLSATLQTWLNGLLLNNQLSVLNPAQRLAEARSQFESALTSGNASQITGAADAYLREARDYFASGDGYSTLFNLVRSQVAALVTPTPTGTVGGPVATPLPPVSGSIGGGSSAATTASTVAASAATTAVAAANATVDAVNQTKAILAEIMAQTKNAVVTEAENTRAADAANTDKVVAAVSDRASQRAL